MVTGKISVALAVPGSTGVSRAVASTVLSAGKVSTGLVVSIMVMVTIPTEPFPLASVAEQVTFVTPNGKPSGVLQKMSTG